LKANGLIWLTYEAFRFRPLPIKENDDNNTENLSYLGKGTHARMHNSESEKKSAAHN